MQYRFFIFISCILFLCGSCQTFHEVTPLEEELKAQNEPIQKQLQESKKKREFREEVQQRFKHIRRLIYDKKLLEAENQLATMRQLKEYKKEVEQLDELISLAKTLTTDTTEQAFDEQLQLKESTDALRLPKKYNKTIVKEKDEDFYNMPRSSLEQLMERKVSMKILNMSLAEFAMQLDNLDGLNIADPLNIVFSSDVVKDKTFSANFKDVPLRELFSYISSNLGVDFNIVDNMIWVSAAATNKNNGVKLESKIIKLRQGLIPKIPEGIGVSGTSAFASNSEEDTDLEMALKAFYNGSQTGGSYTLFKTRNKLLVTDTRTNIRQVEALVEELDKPPYQVVIEAKFLTVSQSDLRDVGVEITHTDGGTTGTDLDESDSANSNLSEFFTELDTIKTGNADGVGAMTISGIIGNRNFDVLISAIESKESTVTISAPRITTLNNRTARIRKGDKRYYFEQYDVQTIDNGDDGEERVLVPYGKPASLPLGITFDVRANIGNDGHTILLGLKPEIINFLEWEDYSTSSTRSLTTTTTETNLTEVKLPRTHEQTIAASVAIESGETVVLGGMIENEQVRLVKKIPFLGDIPYLGFFFRRTEETSQPTNLLIFVTATVIDENGQYIITDKKEKAEKAE